MNKQEMIQELDGLIGTKLEPNKERSKDDGKYGRAAEEALGVEENNSKKADLVLDDGSAYEIKTTNGKSNQTLFNKKADNLCPELGINSHRDLLGRYPDTQREPKTDNPQRKCFNVDLKTTGFNKNDWRLVVDETRVIAEHRSDGNVLTWDIEKLKETAVEKLEKKIDIIVDKQGVVQGYEIHEGFCADQFVDMIKSGEINLSIKIRIDPQAKIKYKDRGMGFRCPPKKTGKLYL